MILVTGDDGHDVRDEMSYSGEKEKKGFRFFDQSDRSIRGASDSPSCSQVNPKVCEQRPWHLQKISPPEHQVVFALHLLCSPSVLRFLLLVAVLRLRLLGFDRRRGDEEQSEQLQRKHGAEETVAVTPQVVLFSGWEGGRGLGNATRAG